MGRVLSRSLFSGGEVGSQEGRIPTSTSRARSVLTSDPPLAVTQGHDPLWGVAWFSHLQKKGLDSLYIKLLNTNALQGWPGDKKRMTCVRQGVGSWWTHSSASCHAEMWIDCCKIPWFSRRI